MYRKIMDYLKEWKHSEHRKPLILQGQDKWEKHIPFWSLDVPVMKM